LPIHYATLVRLRWRLRVVCRWASPLLSIFRCNFSKSENGPKICGFGGFKGENMKDECWDPPRKSIPTETRHPVRRMQRYSQKCVLQSLARKVKKEKITQLNIIFHPFAPPTPLSRFVPFWHVGSDRRRNHPSQILSRLIQGFGGYECPNFGVSHWLW